MLTVKKSQQKFIGLLILFTAIILPWIVVVLYEYNTQQAGGNSEVMLVNFKRDTVVNVDHSKFWLLQQEFSDPREVTKACLTCHNKIDREIMMSSHWKWTREYITEQGDTIELGKENIINNFCIGISSNEPLCTSCHIGYGWKDSSFDHTDKNNIDCLVCHDQTGTYKKFPAGAGFPVAKTKKFGNKTFTPPDYNLIAQNIGKPKKDNCGACHFNGGGGNNVKHGDIAREMNQVTHDIDVHMAIDGAKMNCTDCHKTEHHNITGNLYSIASVDDNRVSCEQCHTGSPHTNSILNQHTDKIACQTCHIPEYAKVSSTKMSWDWSTAGKLNSDGSLITEKDSLGNMTYFTKKGSFVWKNNVEPEYVWFNGNAKHYVTGDKVDPDKVVKLNTLLGSYSDKKAKIIPIKKHVGKQIYDTENNIMIIPHLFGKDSTAYWGNYDWDKAAQVGMASAGLPYSGNYGFISTEMSWPINHMVASRNESLKCADCHTSNGRLNSLTDFYLPGRDKSNFLDRVGIILILMSFAGVFVHAGLRIINRK